MFDILIPQTKCGQHYNRDHVFPSNFNWGLQRLKTGWLPKVHVKNSSPLLFSLLVPCQLWSALNEVASFDISNPNSSNSSQQLAVQLLDLVLSLVCMRWGVISCWSQKICWPLQPTISPRRGQSKKMIALRWETICILWTSIMEHTVSKFIKTVKWLSVQKAVYIQTLVYKLQFIETFLHKCKHSKPLILRHLWFNRILSVYSPQRRLHVIPPSSCKIYCSRWSHFTKLWW